MAFRIITALSAIVLLYCAAEWGRIAWLDHKAMTPAAPFLVQHEGSGPPVTLLIDYRCGNCGAVYQAFTDLQELQPDRPYIIRPVPYIDAQSELLVRLAMAAGLEGKFTEIHQAFAEKGGEFPESFLRETLSLYGMDYDDLLERAHSEAVSKLVADNIDDATWFGANTVPSLIVGAHYHRLPDPIDTINATHLLPLLAPAP